jgi:hypothetical protein
MTKSKKPGSRTRGLGAQDIFDLWVASAKSGLGVGKKYAADVFTEYEPKFLDSIQAMLDAGEVFDAEARKGTTRVANDVGKICRMFTLDKTVSKDTFILVFTFVNQNHPVCPSGGGGGGWCEI